MGKRKDVVITAYGHGKTIDKIAVSTFEQSKGYYSAESDMNTYCCMINSLELTGDSWVSAKSISYNAPYSLNDFLPLPAGFTELILKLDDRAIQKLLVEIDSQELASALKNTTDDVKQKIFCNMSKNSSKELEKDIENIGIQGLMYVEDTQKKIVRVIRHLEESGEIVIYNANKMEESNGT